ncbi:hypothetical protein NQ318_023145 [Aromia moschata]|uniref:EF-hand domain-containing protein n=1 Tax=Aromia moschata TaxID=1265417 RepID=A0AAV8XF56_9CUCU|nr:hypothetical protein NQ318_023145 [Aromia moschata]
MERMRETVFKEMDRNNDGFIDYNEFYQQTNTNDFKQDHGWQALDEQRPYTDEELAEYIRQHQMMANQIPQGYPGGYQMHHDGHQQGPPPGYQQLPSGAYQVAPEHHGNPQADTHNRYLRGVITRLRPVDIIRTQCHKDKCRSIQHNRVITSHSRHLNNNLVNSSSKQPRHKPICNIPHRTNHRFSNNPSIISSSSNNPNINSNNPNINSNSLPKSTNSSSNRRRSISNHSNLSRSTSKSNRSLISKCQTLRRIKSPYV